MVYMALFFIDLRFVYNMENIGVTMLMLLMQTLVPKMPIVCTQMFMFIGEHKIVNDNMR